MIKIFTKLWKKWNKYVNKLMTRLCFVWESSLIEEQHPSSNSRENIWANQLFFSFFSLSLSLSLPVLFFISPLVVTKSPPTRLLRFILGIFAKSMSRDNARDMIIVARAMHVFPFEMHVCWVNTRNRVNYVLLKRVKPSYKNNISSFFITTHMLIRVDTTVFLIHCVFVIFHKRRQKCSSLQHKSEQKL